MHPQIRSFRRSGGLHLGAEELPCGDGPAEDDGRREQELGTLLAHRLENAPDDDPGRAVAHRLL